MNLLFCSKNVAIQLLIFIFILIFTVIITGCGSDDDRVYFVGNISNSSGNELVRSAQVRQGEALEDLSGIQICFQGKCDITDTSGNYGFNIDQNIFTAGNNVFIFSGRGINTQTSVDIPSGGDFIRINFTVLPDNTVDVILIDISGGSVPITPQPTIIGTLPTPTFNPEPTFFPQGTPTVVFEPTAIATPTTGPAPVSSICVLLSGSYSGDGGCQLGSVNITESGGDLIFSPFGSNSSTTFILSGDTGVSASSNLILFNKPDHSCDMTCREDAFTLKCKNSEGGNCTEEFSK